MKKFITGIILSLATITALAMPRPSDISSSSGNDDWGSSSSSSSYDSGSSSSSWD
jgi:hypothetical protein